MTTSPRLPRILRRLIVASMICTGQLGVAHARWVDDQWYSDRVPLSSLNVPRQLFPTDPLSRAYPNGYRATVTSGACIVEARAAFAGVDSFGDVIRDNYPGIPSQYYSLMLVEVAWGKSASGSPPRDANGRPKCYAEVSFQFYDWRSNSWRSSPILDYDSFGTRYQYTPHMVFYNHPCRDDGCYATRYDLPQFGWLSIPADPTIPPLGLNREGWTLHRITLSVSAEYTVTTAPKQTRTLLIDTRMCDRIHCPDFDLGNCPTDRPGSHSQMLCRRSN